MIDFIKIKIPKFYISQLLEISFLSFYNPNLSVDAYGNAITKKRSNKKFIALEAEYNHLTISITRKGNIILYGSLHKFWTNGRNDNDFHLDQVFESLVKMELELKIDLSKCEVQNIELSVNLYELPTSTGNIISGLLGTKLQRSKYGLKQFEKQYTDKKGNYYRCDRSQYNTKIYDKALHVRSSKQILRIELQLKNNECIRRFTGINTLYDLSGPTHQLRAIETILNNWSTVLIYDTTMSKKGPHKKYRNYHFWNDLENKHSFHYHRKRLAAASKEFGVNIHEVIHTKMKEKCDQLTASKKDSILRPVDTYNIVSSS